MKLYTKESLITELQKIAKRGWIENARKGNDGGIGNTLEDLLGFCSCSLHAAACLRNALSKYPRTVLSLLLISQYSFTFNRLIPYIPHLYPQRLNF